MPTLAIFRLYCGVLINSCFPLCLVISPTHNVSCSTMFSFHTISPYFSYTLCLLFNNVFLPHNFSLFLLHTMSPVQQCFPSTQFLLISPTHLLFNNVFLPHNFSSFLLHTMSPVQQCFPSTQFLLISPTHYVSCSFLPHNFSLFLLHTMSPVQQCFPSTQFLLISPTHNVSCSTMFFFHTISPYFSYTLCLLFNNVFLPHNFSSFLLHTMSPVQQCFPSTQCLPITSIIL